MSNAVSRRSFVQGAGALALGSSAATSVAMAAEKSATKDASASAAAEAQATANLDYSSWLPEEPEISDDMVEEEVEADVIVVGVGDSGR